MIFKLTLLTAVLAAPSLSQVRPYVTAHREEILKSFQEFVAIPNVAADPAGLDRNAAYIVTALQKRSVKTQLLEVPGAPKVVFGEIAIPGATHSVTFYAHYDGQPVEPAKWKTAPFTPTLIGDRLYGRSTSDDKAPIQAILSALDAGAKPTVTVRFFFEGEEEAGSPHLQAILEKYKARLPTDLWLICDGPVDQSRSQQIYFGARGVASASLTVYGPNHELHSGHYGNWAPNPAMMLARLLASMKDDSGRVLIDGFYDGIEPLGATERKAIHDAPVNDAALMHELGLARTEGSGRLLDDLITEPALNIQGFASASIGATARNVIPATATADIGLRLVKGTDYKQELDRLAAHIRKQGYFLTDAEPDLDTRLTHPKIATLLRKEGYNAARTSMDLPVSRKVLAAVEAARGLVVALPTLGGSVPLYLFTDFLKTPAIGIPIANHDNNQHSSNENLRLQNLWDGIETMAALIALNPADAKPVSNPVSK